MNGPVSDEIRATWPLKKVVSEIKKSIRTDYGGASTRDEKLERVISRLRSYEECEGLGDQELHIIAKVVLREHALVRDGIAKRVANHTNELEARVARLDPPASTGSPSQG